MSGFGQVSQLESDPILSLVLNSFTDQAVFTIDPTGIITTWNEGCHRMKLYTEEEAIGQNFSILYTASERDEGRPEHNLRKSREDGQYHEEGTRVRKGGEQFTAEVSIYPIEENGQLEGFAKIVRDISKRKLLEQERDDLDERLKGIALDLERSTKELEGFCFSVAHDLRSPIRAIVSMSRIVRVDYGQHLPEEAREHLDTVARSGLRLSHSVDDLLKFAKLGKAEVRRQPVDVTDLAKRLASEVGPECQGGTAQIEVEEGMSANADPSMVELVLRNLIENACKYSAANVSISVSMEMVGDELVYSVRDDGMGFDMQFVAKLFEPFERLHTDEFAGSGIGLANVRRIIERHGGKVWAESELHKGSKFSFTLGKG